MPYLMPPLSFPSFDEDSCSGGKSSSATSCDTFPSALLYKLLEPARRLWLFLTGRSTRATSFLFSFSCATLYCRARWRPSANRKRRLRCGQLLDKIGLNEGRIVGEKSPQHSKPRTKAKRKRTFAQMA